MGVANAEIGAVIEEQLEQLGVALADGDVNRGAEERADVVGIGTAIEEPGGRGGFAMENCRDERRHGHFGYALWKELA